MFNRLLTQTVDRILAAHHDHPPVIIIQGDHGPGVRFNQVQLDHTDVFERFSILNAYYLPGVDSAGLYRSISPVNSFRVVLNNYFGTHYSMEPDRSFYSPSYWFLHLQEVTDQIAERDRQISTSPAN